MNHTNQDTCSTTVPYKTISIDLGADDQKKPEFLGINPNGRIPVIIDHNRNDFPVFESGAIVLYFAEHYDKDSKFSFQDANEKSKMLQWLFFQNAGIQYGIDRYQNETKRLYSMLEKRLKGRDYLVGKGRGKYSVANISTFMWARLKEWSDRIGEREAVKRGLLVPREEDQIVRLRDPNVEDPFKGWFMKRQNEVKEKHGK
ncbi:hypothetical protein BU25DRAFT_436368 [Macroventuria anomochaeta]|uniref:Uncharacterized protein n=1 Tax=Macroventuria anomochaeta TaxID=301207 RepID=A0ACB6SE40_9PLEO|nr:uncharacterized protein BU25DRAFT_436368 [Macroventuria anomochaeta]KAF2632586.1 hypothetical protein BU25DRAFT_436368 [Macroventuria anomochaeta]